MVEQTLKHKAHKCIQRKDNRSFWAQIRTWYLVPLHLVYTVLMLAGLLFVLDNQFFAVGARPTSHTDGWRPVYQSDITTLVSTLLLGLRLIVSAWHGLVAWKCVYLLLEKASLRLSDISRMISWKVPAKTSNMHYALLVLTVLLLAWPSQLAAPILTGALIWLPAYQYGEWSNLAGVAPVASPGNPWEDYKKYSDVRQTLILQSLGIANAGSPTVHNDSLIPSPPAQRMLSAFHDRSNGTKVRDVRLPWITVENISWIADPYDSNQLDATLKNSVVAKRQNFNSLNFSSPNNPLQDPITGNMALLRSQPWVPPTSKNLPDPNQFSGTAHVGVLVGRWENPERKDCTLMGPRGFGALPPIKMLQINYDNNFTNCYAVASLQLSAGVVNCGPTLLADGSIADCTLSKSNSKLITSAIGINVMPDPLVAEALAMVSETMRLIATTSGIYYSTSKEGQLDAYVRDVLSRAYQSSWTALTATIGGNNTVSVSYQSPHPVIQLSLVKERVYVWAVFNVCFTFASILLYIASKDCEVKSGDDPILGAMLLDSSRVLEQDSQGICNAQRLTQLDDKTLGYLRLRKPSDADCSGFHHHLWEPVGNIRAPSKVWDNAHDVEVELMSQD